MGDVFPHFFYLNRIKEFVLVNKDIIDAFKTVAKAKNIDRTNLSSIIENLFVNIIKRKYGCRLPLDRMEWKRFL